MKAERFNFTKARIDALPKPDKGRVYYRDTKCPGLMLAVTSTGGRSFFRGGRMQGRPTRLLLGRFPDLTVDDARKACQAANGDVAKGQDPHERRLAARHEQTLKGLFTHWLEAHAKPHKRSWKEDERLYNVFLKRWANRRLSAITKADVQALHKRVGAKNGRYAANRLLALLKAAFNKADAIGYTGPNPAAGVEAFREESRERFLAGDELPRFFTALADEPEIYQSYFLLSLLTGARRANVQAMQWVDIDLEAGRWRIPATQAKAKAPIVVALVPAAVAILKLRRQSVEASPWVFPTRSKTGHLVEPKFAWARILKRAGLTDVRPHDLRRTLGSWQACLGASLPIIGKSLGHTQASTTQIYARLQLDPIRQSVEAATTAMLAAGKITFDGEVLTLPPPPKSDKEPAAD